MGERLVYTQEVVGSSPASPIVKYLQVLIVSTLTAVLKLPYTTESWTSFIIYCTLNRRDWRTIALSDLSFDAEELECMLLSLLRRDIDPEL